MDPNFIAAFVSSTTNVFSTMLQLPVTTGEPTIKQDRASSHDVSGIISVSGGVVGTIVLSLPRDVAENITSLFCGMQLEAGSEDFNDAVGELVNMVSGGAKAEFAGGGGVSISVPSVIVGASHSVSSRTDIPCVQIPCSTDCGAFLIELSLRAVEASQAATAKSMQG